MPSVLRVVLLPRLLIRKKLLSFGKCPVPLLCLLEEVERPEKFLFSEATAEELLELKSCVMSVNSGVSSTDSSCWVLLPRRL